ncbi:hypothetical protein CJ030_MR1G010283 [Morella rubra]|uniref:Uncharacterized protein n=1 Tax=Morella rubra TaxID=262757 RepID=A0A6A1WQB2_9ROSI|nr:hypothetical protein CJ030_MR1G010283 [Morella rubra]
MSRIAVLIILILAEAAITLSGGCVVSRSLWPVCVSPVYWLLWPVFVCIVCESLRLVCGSDIVVQIGYQIFRPGLL